MNASEPMRNPLAGKVALITGGAKRVGRAIALRLAQEGMDIAFTFNTSHEEAETTKQQIQQLGRQVQAIRADLSEPSAAEYVHQTFSSRFNRLDALVNNASCLTATPLGQVTPSDFQQFMAINAMAPLMLIQRFTALLSAGDNHPNRQTGRVVNLVDEHVLGPPLKNHIAYSASKAALAQITKTCALELAPKVTVNAIALGVVAWPESSTIPYQEQYLTRVPLERTGDVEDAAATVLFLIRDASYCTGEIVRVDGGRSLT